MRCGCFHANNQGANISLHESNGCQHKIVYVLDSSEASGLQGPFQMAQLH